MSQIKEFLLWPIKKYRLIVNNMHSQDPREKTWAMYEVASIFLCPYGLDIFELDYKQSARTWIIGLVLFDVNLFALYSAIYYCYKQEPMLVLQAMTTYGITIPNVFPYYRAVTDYHRYRSLLNFGLDYPLKNNDKKLKMILLRRATNFSNATFIITLMLFFSGMCFALYSTYAYFALDKHVLLMCVILPFVDPDTTEGFYINSANLLFVAISGVFGNVGIELGNCAVVHNLRVGFDVVSFECDKLSMDLKTKKHFDTNMKRQFRNILVQVQDIDRFIIELNTFFYWKFLVQPVLVTLSISGAVFSIKMIDYKSGYGWVGFAYSQVLILSYMGSEVKDVNQDLQESIYGISWYLLPPREQKMIAHILNRLQNGGRLTIGPFSDLDFEIAARITKAIFNFTTALLSFV